MRSISSSKISADDFSSIDVGQEAILVSLGIYLTHHCAGGNEGMGAKHGQTGAVPTDGRCLTSRSQSRSPRHPSRLLGCQVESRYRDQPHPPGRIHRPTTKRNDSGRLLTY
jgi:hypothetical protein